jgi:hypothetical protein
METELADFGAEAQNPEIRIEVPEESFACVLASGL